VTVYPRLHCPEPGSDLSALITERLEGPALDAVGEVSQCAMRMGIPTCLVGGPVRDLLLGKELTDLDVVVVGDGIAFARELSGLADREMVPFSRFGTAFVVLSSGIRIDVATARRESYPEAGDLPLVEPATLEEDLRRRDFTINAMAIRLGPDRYGSFIDLHEGCRDLRAGVIRVLHEGSFRDDPTRILRAVRFRSRLDYELTAETGELLHEAVAGGLLEEISRERIREELVLILSEKSVIDALAMLSDTGTWDALFKSSVKSPEDTGELFRQGDEALEWYLDCTAGSREETVEPWVIRWLLLGADTSPEVFASVSDTFHMGRAVRRAVGDRAGRYGSALEALRAGGHLSDSVLYRSLSGLTPESMVLLAREGEEVARRGVARFLTRLVDMDPFVDGNDLREMNVEEGPLLGEILEAIFEAQLDGRVTDRAAALSLARDLATASGKGR